MPGYAMALHIATYGEIFWTLLMVSYHTLVLKLLRQESELRLEFMCLWICKLHVRTARPNL